MSETKYGSQGKVILILGTVFAVMLVLNHFMPIHRDDYDYSMIWLTAQHIGSLQDIVDSVYRHYFLHGGRAVTVFGLDLFLYLGKVWFDLVNAAIFTGLVALLFMHGSRNTDISKAPGLLAVTAFFAWLSFPHFGEVAVWKSGSTVYLWSGFLVALFLLPYNLFQAAKWKYSSALFAGLMFLLGILAGWSVENLAVTTVTVALGSCWYCHKKQNMPGWMPAGACGAVIGLIGIVAAPGNYVRYDAQGSGKGILTHVGNIIAGNGEMMLYILPMVLLIILAYRILQQKCVPSAGISLTEGREKKEHWTKGRIILLLFIVLSTVSYFTNGFIQWTLHGILVKAVLLPFGLTKPNTLDLFANTMSGFDEMAIYWFTIFFIYSLVKGELGISRQNLPNRTGMAELQELLKKFKDLRFAMFMFALAIYNNLVMIAAPTFPARATFSSVAMIIIGCIAMLRIKEVQSGLRSGLCGEYLINAAVFLGLFTISAAVMISYQVSLDDQVRIKMLQEAGTHGGEIVHFQPIANAKRRALRHVYYEDFSNGVTKDGAMKYFRVKDIIVDKQK